MKNGIVADIQRCSFHDGGGIRTSVFLKGCNMRCAWCHNPETISPEPQYLINEEKCIGCGQCADGCYAGARTLCGTRMTAEEVAEVVLLDAPYYGDDGGVTVTGGEPSVQGDFAAEILKICHEKGIHTAVETNMLCSWTRLFPLLQNADLIMADLKVFDSSLHRQWTGVENIAIKENFMKAAELQKPMILRTPVIAGINDNIGELSAIASFAEGLSPLLYYELLPYHSLGLSKGKIEGSDFVNNQFEKMSLKKVEELAQSIKSCCREIRVAGKRIL